MSFKIIQDFLFVMLWVKGLWRHNFMKSVWLHFNTFGMCGNDGLVILCSKCIYESIVLPW